MSFMSLKVAISLVLLLCCSYLSYSQTSESVNLPAIEFAETIENKAIIFPNPGIGLVALERKHPFSNAQIRVLSITGTIEKTKENFNGPICGLDLTGLPQGIYFIEILEDDLREVLRWERE